jgi:hypothetical protein
VHGVPFVAEEVSQDRPEVHVVVDDQKLYPS